MDSYIHLKGFIDFAGSCCSAFILIVKHCKSLFFAVIQGNKYSKYFFTVKRIIIQNNELVWDTL